MKIEEVVLCHIVEGYREAQQSFKIESNDQELVDQTIDQFRSLVDKNQVHENERNIDWWRKQGWDKFSKFVDSKMLIPTKKQIKQKKFPGKSITLKETDQWLIVIPLDHASSCFHGKSTDWCTSRPTGHYFDSYFLDQNIVLIYILNKKSGEKWAIAVVSDTDEIELINQNNENISREKFKSDTGFDPFEIVKSVPKDDSRISQVKLSRTELLKSLKETMETWKKSNNPTRNPELEKYLIQSKHAESSAEYLRLIGEYQGEQEFPEEIAIPSVVFDIQTFPFIKNPKQSVQLAAVQHDGEAIEWIRNPSERIQIAAVQQSPKAIGWIRDPGEKVQMMAVQANWGAIKYIDHPTESVQLIAVSKYGKAIRYIENPNERVQMAAVQNDKSSIDYIENPYPSVLKTVG